MFSAKISALVLLVFASALQSGAAPIGYSQSNHGLQRRTHAPPPSVAMYIRNEHSQGKRTPPPPPPGQTPPGPPGPPGTPGPDSEDCDEDDSQTPPPPMGDEWYRH
ncbi:hypothetical protein ONZ45_g18606 [Pleurotus djamor]|nr:hypothetical protein ONZ45_g18606 [Pleurotus djamor]